MKAYAVAHMCLFNNVLKTEILLAENARSAIFGHSKMVSDDPHLLQWLNKMPEAMENIKTYFFDCDQMIDVVELIRPSGPNIPEDLSQTMAVRLLEKLGKPDMGGTPDGPYGGE